MAAAGGALLFLFAGDWGTLLLAWVVTDVALAYAAGGRGIKWTLPLSLGGGVALGTALVLWQWSAPTLMPRAASLLALAATLRLLPWPLLGWWSAMERDERPTTRVVVYAIPVLLGAWLWATLTRHGVSGDYAGVIGAGAMVVGAIGAWWAKDPDEAVLATAAYGVAIPMLGAGLGLPAAYLSAIGVYATLSVVTVLLSWGYCHHLRIAEVSSWWRGAPIAVAVLSLAGMPLTVGFPARVAIYKGLFAARRWLLLLAVMVAEALALAALLRIMLDLEGEEEEQGGVWRYEMGYGSGAVCALALVAAGVLTRPLGLPGFGRWFAMPTLPVWAALILPVVGAVAVYRSQWLGTLQVPGLRVDGIYRAIESLWGRLRALIWGTTLVVEGQGYIAWVTLVCLVILIFILSH